MTSIELYIWICVILTSLAGLWGLFLVFSYIVIYLIEQTMKHFNVWELFFDWVVARDNKRDMEQ